MRNFIFTIAKKGSMRIFVFEVFLNHKISFLETNDTKFSSYCVCKVYFPPSRIQMDLPVRKIIFDTALERYSDDHFSMSFSFRECISGKNWKSVYSGKNEVYILPQYILFKIMTPLSLKQFWQHLNCGFFLHKKRNSKKMLEGLLFVARLFTF